MANYINITLDTIAPSGVSILVNGDADKVTSTAAVLSIGCTDESTDGYQMKIWGTADAPTEADAIWETYRTSKNVTLASGDGLKTVYVKVRDDVWNESSAVSDSVTLYEKVPAISSFSVDNSRISLTSGKDCAVGAFYADEKINAAKLMIVQNVNAPHDSPSNIAIPTTNGSDIHDDNYSVSASDAVLEFNGEVDSVIGINYTIRAADLVAVAPGDGIKIIKAFVRSAATGSWSV